MKKLILLLILFLSFNQVFANNSTLDSISKEISKIKNVKKRIDALNGQVEYCWYNGEYLNGLTIVDKAIELAKQEKYSVGLAFLLMNKGIIYDYLGRYPEAIHHYLESMKIMSKSNNKLGVCKLYNNIGLTYENQKKYPLALQYYGKSLELAKKINNKRAISVAINNIGIIYMHEKKHDLALRNYFYCIKYEKELNDTIALGDSYNNIGIIYLNQKKFNKAEEYFSKSLKIRIQTNDRHGISNSYNNLGSLYNDKQELTTAKTYFLKSLEISTKMGINKSIQYSYEQLADIAKKEKNTADELHFFKLSTRFTDSINNEANLIQQTQDEMQYAFDQKVNAEKLKDHKKDLKIEHEKHKQQVILWAVISLTIIILIFSWFLFKRWRVEKNQNQIIEQQKLIVEEKNREILDSITYAKRIQSAILPPEKLVKEYLLNSFVLYKPKDIVAGDFYWIEPSEDLIIFAVADCTGHGVPGAMVSVVCHNALNRSVREFGLTVPGEILDKTREIIVTEFGKNDENVYDGMDISLCSLNLTTKELQWAGANSPLWMITRRDSSIIEISPNKQPVGKHFHYTAFETQTMQVEEGDSIYLFTDGYIDQFGGDDEKKFKSKKMRELILEINHHPMHVQRSIFDETFEKWKGDFEQVDDVCVIGIRL